MKLTYLFPHRFKFLSGILFILSAILLISALFDDLLLFETFELKTTVFAIAETGIMGQQKSFSIIENNIIDEIIFTLFILSGLVFAFSKEKMEDEMTEKIRLDSLVWATYCNYIVFLLCVWLVYGVLFLNVLMFAVFTHLVFFIIRFNWKMYQLRKANTNEE
ncbi:hypothetical protein ABGT15_09905 [Flavobacterium enshiense]|uniref:hypothetical protein n=1 Tax=Flavobacterium enshiense TaxID=1341165 RepID=UPI00345DE194